MRLLAPVKAEHADRLYDLVKDSSITDTIRWDGPDSREQLRSELHERQLRTARGEMHAFTIIDPRSREPMGSAHFRDATTDAPAEIGLWIGEAFQNKGIGTEAVAELTKYGFERFPITRITSHVFVGNGASRRIFEKCGYTLEAVARRSMIKRGKKIDVWLMTITREDYLRRAAGIGQ